MDIKFEIKRFQSRNCLATVLCVAIGVLWKLVVAIAAALATRFGYGLRLEAVHGGN